MNPIYQVGWMVARARSLEDHLIERGRHDRTGPARRDEDRLRGTGLDLCNGNVSDGGDEESEEKGDHVDSLTWLVY
jgi:hypothetical protein